MSVKRASGVLLAGAVLSAVLGTTLAAVALPSEVGGTSPYPSAQITNLGTARVAGVLQEAGSDGLPVAAALPGSAWEQIWQVGRHGGGTVLELRLPDGQVRVLEEGADSLAGAAAFRGSSEQVWMLEAANGGYRIRSSRYGNCLTDLGPAQRLAGRPCGADRAQIWVFVPVPDGSGAPASPSHTARSTTVGPTPSSARSAVPSVVRPVPLAACAAAMLVGVLLFVRRIRRRGPRLVRPAGRRFPVWRRQAADTHLWARHLADPDVPFLAAVVANAAESSTDENAATAWVYAVLYDDEQVTVRLAGAETPVPAPPWQRGKDPGVLALPRQAIADLPVPTAPSCYVLLGVTDRCTVLIDLLRAPGLVSLTGDRDRRTAVARSLIHQIAAGRHPEPVTLWWSQDVAVGGPPLSALLDEVARADADTPAVLFSAHPSPEDARRLDRLLSDHHRLCVIVVGEPPAGARWTVEVAEDGTLAVAPLGLTARAGAVDVPDPRTDPSGPAGPPRPPALPAGLRRASV
ncbi:hypothetical protein BX265_6899 [Streptomyces sp. TLI_235]|nr:RICIN domain-containing protein [Streptomyces sp. TLI_235]PBC69570.1 hypothetical protein BX265_6899 [Streptomyces sp. TLI_235]